jgi:tRNA pseudouridine55 synthase
MKQAAGPDGLAVIDKPAGWTSHDVVAKLRGVLGTRKVGHAGTLDPDATGVLLVGVGRATRLMRFMTALPKSYVGEIVLGAETNTLDSSGDVTATHDRSDVTLDAARAAAVALTGEIEQVPPMVSAVKVGGRRLHELAREGIEIERDARPVTVHRLELFDGPEAGVLRVEVDCSSGTYVRTLAADLGHLLGGGAHLRNLRRTAIGSFTLDEATTIDAATPLPMPEALRDLSQVTVDEDVAALVRNGRVLDLEALGVSGDPPWPLLAPDGSLLAVYEPVADGNAKPTVVIPS